MTLMQPTLELKYNEILIICPHCDAELIKKIEVRATGIRHGIINSDRCTECQKWIQ